MRFISFISFSFCFAFTTIQAQVGINIKNPKATLDVVNEDTGAAGILAPRLTRAKLISLDTYYLSEQAGAILYITELGNETLTSKTINIDNTGYYVFNGSVWQSISLNPWYKVGTTRPSTNNTDNSYISAKIAIGTNKPANINGGVENADLTINGSAVIDGIGISRGKAGMTNIAIGENAISNSNVNSMYNLAVGDQALQSLTSGTNNIAIGANALKTSTTQTSNIAIGYNSLTKSTANNNIAIGDAAMQENTIGTDNVAIGINSLQNGTSSNENIAIGNNTIQEATTASLNIAIGNSALNLATTASSNIAIGRSALRNNRTNVNNIAIGYLALENNIANKNVGIGTRTLNTNTTGTSNIAINYNALMSNTIGNNNVAIGENTLTSNTEGNNNIAINLLTLTKNSTGNNNIAVGYTSLAANTTGNNNIAVGVNSMTNNTIGSNNVAIGYNALQKNIGEGNTVIGSNSVLTENANLQNITALGSSVSITGNNSTGIGYGAVVTTDNTIVLGNTNITKIQGAVTMTTFSDKRFKKDIKENVPGLDFIKRLRPVTYRIDTEAIAKGLDIPVSNRDTYQETLKSKIVQTGFIAQEVEQAANEIGYNFSGLDIPKNEKDYYGLRYSEFVVPLVKSVQEQQQIIENQQESFIQLDEEIKKLEKRLAILEQK